MGSLNHMAEVFLKVGLDARLLDGLNGGIQQAVMGLADGLSKLADGEEAYYFLAYPESLDWLRPNISDRCKIILTELPGRHGLLRMIEAMPLGQFWAEVLRRIFKRSITRLPVSNGLIEAERMDVMHFTFQSAFLTRIPSIYQPWDLQHVHFPNHFYKYQRLMRDYRYRQFCRRAGLVSVGYQWMQAELVRHYQLETSKVRVIPMAPPVDAYPSIGQSQLSSVREKYGLLKPFLLYPAQTHPHKNHIGLIEALSQLRRRKEIRPTIVCTGMQTGFFPKIQKTLKAHSMENQVRFLGFIPPADLQCIYQLCQFMIFPSRYEGWGLPITEALRLGVPIACADLMVFREQAKDAALFFDPACPDDMADAIERLWTDERLRYALAERGKVVAGQYSWHKTAKMFRAHYRWLAGRRLTDEDRTLIQESA
jgi:glycosyltransferase involved in cell wall biosynthesis